MRSPKQELILVILRVCLRSFLTFFLPFFSSILYSLSCSAETKSSQVSLSYGVRNLLYQEFSDGGSELDRESGNLQVAGLSWRQSINAHHKLILSAEYQNAILDYKGHTQSGTPHITNTEETMKQYVIGWQWQPEWFGTYFSAINWQSFYWSRGIQPNNGVLGLKEAYDWQGLEGAVGRYWSVGPLSLSAQLRLSYLFNGQLKIDMNDLGYGHVYIKLPDAYAYGLTFDGQLPITDGLLLGLKYKYDNRHFSKSEKSLVTKGFSTLNLHQPENHAQSHYLAIALSYSF